MDSDTLPTSGIVVHIWPGQWDLPTFDPLCLATVIYLQLVIPGKFSLVECSNPDSSPTGQLPFLVHEQYTVASFEAIVKYVSGLASSDGAVYESANLDAHLTPSEKAQRTAWFAHAESHLGDLVYHTLYANPGNWANVTNPALASIFPVPQKYYVPRRMRDSYYPRLASAGLWKEAVEEKPPQPKFPRDVKPAEKEKLNTNTTLSQAFDKEKVLVKSRSELDIYNELLDRSTFVFQNKLSSVDVLVAAHIMLLLHPPFSDTLLKDLLTESYPSLISHARKVYALALGANSPTLSYKPSSSSLWALFPSYPKASSSSSKKSSLPTPEDLYYRKMRWGFLGVALGSLAVYATLVLSQTQITWRPAKEHNEGVDDEGQELELEED